ncbi:MarR family winged helix-turn-helix transcriptional regulator [Microbacterium sp.]|uniref:MarR family winged helix-turn-helix transcriptional regulator n=1 Tax=Microbacterium sp. TaxID=51671 RepID=UPI0039E451D4
MPERPPLSPVIGLLTVSAIWEGRLAEKLRGLGISTRKYGLLGHIDATPGISFSELARRSSITVQSAHTAVRALVDDGLVEDATRHAGTASDLRVTARGAEVLATAHARLAELDARLADEAPELAAVLAASPAAMLRTAT